MQKGIILSIDDDANLQTVLNQYLEDDGYKIITAKDVATALEQTENNVFDVILLDLVLPDGEGINLIPKIKSKSEAAIIVVSGKSDTTEKIICLEMGADDYITKPFEMRELSARIKAVLRRSNDNAQAGKKENPADKREKIYFNGWCLDRTQFQLFDAEQKPAELTAGEFKLLEAFVTSPNRVLSREHLFDLTRDQQYDSYDRAIDIQIARLRKKMGENAALIKTVRGAGYMFTGQVKS
ncbi:MAG: response regulator [Alphaproteobacteria bacterium]|nr:response regulator [Alphaproteobacteria bacterium]